jgi:quinoprotein glucose dehydrogenase
MLTNRTPEAHAWAVEQFQEFRSEGQFVPLSVGKGTVVFPGFDGGAEWGGSAVDPQTGILYVNANDVAWTGGLAESAAGSDSSVHAIYMSQCSICHGDDFSGSPPDFPSLAGVGYRHTPREIGTLIRQGKGRMPAFPALTGDQISQLVQYLLGAEPREGTSAQPSAATRKYHFTGYHKFLDPDGYPAIAPPWGTLNAINLNTGEYEWKVPLGEYPALVAQGLKDTGSENYGGPVVTAGGLVFISATIADRKIRAFDKASGKLLWEAVLPFAATAAPATYMVDGRQYVVIASGAGRARNFTAGGVYVAFALPAP